MHKPNRKSVSGGRREVMHAIGAAMVGVLLSLLITGCDGAEPKPVQMKDEPLEKPLPINTRPRVLAIGFGYSIGIKPDGSVWSWGTNPYRAETLGRKLSKPQDGWNPAKVPDLEGAKSVVAEGAVILLKEDGTVWSWGDGRYGTLGYDASNGPQMVPRQVPGVSGVVDISIDGSTVHAVLADGTVLGWGSGKRGLLGGDRLGPSEHPAPVIGLSSIVRSSPGFSIDRRGRLWSYGECYMPLGREVSPDKRHDCLTPDLVPLPGLVVDVVSCVDAMYALLADGTVWSWGSNSGGRLGIAGISSTVLPKRISSLSRIVHIASRRTGGAAITDSGVIVTWGTSALAPPPPAPFARKDLITPHLVGMVKELPVLFLAGNWEAYALIDRAGDAWYWIGNKHGQRGTGIAVPPSEEYWRVLERSKWTYR